MSIQVLSHYPGIPSPRPLAMWESPPHVCPYLPDRMATMRAFIADSLHSEAYHDFMDAGFRRSGRVIYQPVCAGCRACQPLRVDVSRFRPSKSQRRCVKKNYDLAITVQPPQISDEKFALYGRYLAEWHGRRDSSMDDFREFLYDSPVQTVEFEYRDRRRRLLAVGICDISPKSLSSVYFYFDPRESKRNLGTFSALKEIAYAAEKGMQYYYLGYWVKSCRSMRYKASFRPNEILGTDGDWRQNDEECEEESP